MNLKLLKGVKFSYAKKPLQNELFFGSANLLFERGISNIDLIFIESDGLPAFFPIHQKESAMPLRSLCCGILSRFEV